MQVSHQVKFCFGAASLVSTKTGWATRAVNGWGGGFGGGLYPHHQWQQENRGRKCGEQTQSDGGISQVCGWRWCLISGWQGVRWYRGYLRPSHWATRWIGRSWRQVSARGRKHHLWGSPAHCRLATSSWWSWGRGQEVAGGQREKHYESKRYQNTSNQRSSIVKE